MKYKDLVNKLTYVHNDGYFNSHYSRETHGTGEYNQFAYNTVGTCDCPKCIARALAFGIDDHYLDQEITEEIVAELKAIYGVYGVDKIKDAFKEEEKGSPEMFKPDGELNLSE